VEVKMSSADVTSQSVTASAPPKPGEMRLEVVQVPVSDIDRAKAFYLGLGWREDIDFVVGENFRVVQFTPPGSGCSVSIGKGLSTAEPGSAQGLELAVLDIGAAREDLIVRGVEVSELFHLDGDPPGPVPGPDPERGSYMTYASFSDPDGNGWLLQEITERLPGR
jgi:catechol 2,3-dioxygenase-like lactoylglutathione lyase family enzyme